MNSLVNSAIHLRTKLYQFFYNLFWRTDAKAILPNSYYEAKIILILKADKTLQA